MDAKSSLHPSSNGTLAWLATTMLGAPGRLVGSAWGSDVLVTPQRSALQRGLREHGGAAADPAPAAGDAKGSEHGGTAAESKDGAAGTEHGGQPAEEKKK
jgi:hypothetical protein